MFPTPDPFLVRRHTPPALTNETLVACAGFETRIWRFERLASHLSDWLPEFVFRPEDLPPAIRNTTELRKLMERAVKHLYEEGVRSNRGEIGELLLHVCCRQFFSTFPAISKLFYKTASNDVVKGFDIAHIRTVGAEVELWLGEAKFYGRGDQAVRDAIASVNKHLSNKFLSAEKILLGGKVSTATPGYEKIQWLFDPDTSLDEIFTRIVIPILVAYDSDSCASYIDDASYDALLSTEIRELDALIGDKIDRALELVMLYVPMNAKDLLEASFNKKISGFRP